MSELEQYYNTGLTSADIDTDNGCRETYPCQHIVKIRGQQLPGFYLGTEIYQLYSTNNLQVPDHFQEYGSNFFDRMNSSY